MHQTIIYLSGIINNLVINHNYSLDAQMLFSETRKCLDDPSFSGASQDSLLFLLEMEKLSIKSELDLVNACLKLANSWSVIK